MHFIDLLIEGMNGEFGWREPEGRIVKDCPFKLIRMNQRKVDRISVTPVMRCNIVLFPQIALLSEQQLPLTSITTIPILTTVMVFLYNFCIIVFKKIMDVSQFSIFRFQTV
jgi:hypothetical protein